jgi:polyferredoxin
MEYSGLENLGDCLREPVLWCGIVCPVALLVICTLYLFWLDHKAGKLYRIEVKKKSGKARRKPSRE